MKFAAPNGSLVQVLPRLSTGTGQRSSSARRDRGARDVLLAPRGDDLRIAGGKRGTPGRQVALQAGGVSWPSARGRQPGAPSSEARPADFSAASARASASRTAMPATSISTRARS